MPTKREREYYRMGFQDGSRLVPDYEGPRVGGPQGPPITYRESEARKIITGAKKRKRTLSAWQKFVKANSKKPRFVLRSGKLNLKKMGVAYRKTPAGKKSKRR